MFYKLLGSRKFATKTIYLLTFYFILVANYIFLSPFNLYEREEIIIIEKDLNKILEILNVIVKDQQYYDDLTLIKDLIVKINQMLNSEINITDDFLDRMEKDLNYLDQKYFAQLVYSKNEYVELNDVVRIFAPIQNYYKKKNHEMYVKNLREENRKKREENGKKRHVRKKLTFTESTKNKSRNTISFFKGVLENIDFILNSNFYAVEDKMNFNKLKEKIESWYASYKETNTLKDIEVKDLENIDLEITDFFDKYIIKEPVKENYAERLLYDFEHLEENWKQEMLGGNKDGR